MTSCPACGFDNRAGRKFCGVCGAPIVSRCAACGANNSPGERFCGECGDALPRSPDPRRIDLSAAPRAPAESPGERKTVTILFADIQGSMELLEALDPEEAREIVDPALRRMMDAVQRYGGYVTQSTGDGIFALFGAPIAHEDDPQRALLAALRMQEEIKKYAAKLRLERGVPLQIRIGVNTGETVMRSLPKEAGTEDYVPIGHGTGLAARMQALADPGSIVVAESTYRLAEGYFEFRPLGAARIKGVSEPIRIYELLAPLPSLTKLAAAARRGLVKYVGRRAELEQMRKALDHAMGGRGQVVAVVGEAGVGKSRLFYELKPTFPRGARLLETTGVSHGKGYPYLPLIELLRDYFGIGADDDDQTRREKVAGRLLTLDRALDDALPYLFALLGIGDESALPGEMDAEVRRRRIVDSVRRVLVRESLRQPLIVIVEDLHWIDGETQRFLDALADGIAATPILLLVNYRPEYEHGWGSKTYYAQLRLDPLDRGQAEELLQALVGNAPELAGLKRLLIEKTEGTPFFLEEMVQSLFDRGILERRGTEVALQKPLSEIRVPTTVQAVLSARIDSLPASHKRLLQTAAVVGKEFSVECLDEVLEQSEDEVARCLADLQEAELVYEEPTFPERAYSFKHALTQEVAYHSVLAERRRTLHEKIARTIEARSLTRLDDRYADLAHHYARSGNAEKAFDYLERAAVQARDRSALSEAIRHGTAAIELLEDLPTDPARLERELALQTLLGTAWMAIAGYGAPEVERCFARAREICRTLGDPARAWPVLGGLAILSFVRGDFDAALALGEELAAMSEGPRDPILADSHLTRGWTMLWKGDFQAARDHAERALSLCDPAKQRSLLFTLGQDSIVTNLHCLALALWGLGVHDEARRRSEEATVRARAVSHPFTLAFSLAHSAWLREMVHDTEIARRLAEEALAVSNDGGFVLWATIASFVRGWSLAENGRAEGLAEMESALERWEATGARAFSPHIRARIAEVRARRGETERALELCERALRDIDATGERWCEAELQGLAGSLLRERDEPR